MRLLILLAVALLVSAQAPGGTPGSGVFIDSQERTVVTNVVVGSKSTVLVGADNDFAAAFGEELFDDTAFAAVVLGSPPWCSASAEQNSILLSHTFAAKGGAGVSSAGFSPGTAFANQGMSIFNVKFQVYPEPIQYQLRAKLNAEDLLAGGESGVSVSLSQIYPISAVRSAVLFADAEHASAHVSMAQGVLAPGPYILSVVASASAMVDESGYLIYVTHQADYSVELNFGPAPSADLNDDQVVDGADLVLLLDEWGSCASEGAMCLLADLDSDDEITGGDLALLLGQWTLESR